MKTIPSKIWYLIISCIGFFTFTIAGCGYDDRLKHINSYGKIIVKDVCTQNGKQSWVMNLDLSQTELPNKAMIIPVVVDTIKGQRYDNLIRVFVNIQGQDTIDIFNKQFFFRLDPTSEICTSSPFGLSNYKSL